MTGSRLQRLNVRHAVDLVIHAFLEPSLQDFVMLLQYFIYFTLNLLLLLLVLRDHLLQALRVRFLVLLRHDLLDLLTFELHLVVLLLVLLIEAPDHVGLGHEFLHSLGKVLLTLVLPRVEQLDGFLGYEQAYHV